MKLIYDVVCIINRALIYPKLLLDTNSKKIIFSGKIWVEIDKEFNEQNLRKMSSIQIPLNTEQYYLKSNFNYIIHIISIK